MSVFECDAADGANLASPTVSIVDTDWVREEQVRTLVNGSVYDGNMDYSETFRVTCGVAECVPPGTYEVAIFRRYDVGNFAQLVQMRLNDKPLTQAYAGFGATVGAEEWVTVTRVNRNGNLTATVGGGPYYVTLSEGDVLSFDIGNTNTALAGLALEVQKVRFTEIDPDPPLPSWQKAIRGAETWGDFSTIAMSPFRSRGDVIYGFIDVYTEESEACLGIWTWQCDGTDITGLSGDTPIGFGGAMTDLSDASDRSGLVATGTQILARDFCVLPNGDVLAAWIEQRQPISTRLFRIVVKLYDESSDSWSTLTSDLWGHGEQNRHAAYISVDCNEDGDAFVAWSEATITGTTTILDKEWVWRCKRWDGGSSFTELGTGQTGFPGAAGSTVAGSYDLHLRLRVSPAGVPWVCWPEYDPDNPTDSQLPFAFYWDGSDWVDSEVPSPTLVPTGPGSYSSAADAANYIAFAVYGLFYMDLVFCTHAGPSEDPLLCFQYVWKDQDVISPLGDVSGWSLYDYGGSPGSWGNERFVLEGVDYGDGSVEDLTFASVEAGESDFGGWTQGFNLQHDGQRPWIFSQKGYLNSFVDHAYAARLAADGSTWELRCHGWPDDETFPYRSSGRAVGGWTDPTTNGGCLVGGVPIVIYSDADSWSLGPVLVAGLSCGGIAAMIWSGEAEALDVERIHS